MNGGGFNADELRRALRKRKRLVRTPPAAPPIVYERGLPRRAAAAPAPDPARRVVLEEAVEGCEVRHAQRGKVYVVTTRVDDLDGAADMGERFEQCLRRGDSGLCCRLAAICDPAGLAPADMLFLDVESTGLGSSPLFLIGTMWWERGGFTVTQYLARDYAEEAAALSLFVEACAARPLLVTFNGKSFDFPFVRARAAANGIGFDLAPRQFDLLHESRRAWGQELPDCKLQTLERHVCRRMRHGDIPGSEIPDAYHAFVRTENAGRMVEILRHNLLDLVTLADLMVRMPRP